MSISEQNITRLFVSFQKNFNEEQGLREQIRDIVKDIEQTAREIMTILQGIHSENGISQVPQLIEQADKCLEDAAKGYVKLTSIIPHEEYYKYHDNWKFVSQRLIFLIALTEFLKSGAMVSREAVAEKLSIKVNRNEGFHIDLEDYLSGLLLLASNYQQTGGKNLPTVYGKFAVNSVTSGDYHRPIQISQFVNELNSGFRLLNFKNDSLRKRFDGLKYDLKKIEEVVYDLSIRGLKPGSATEESQAQEKNSDVEQKMDL